MGYDLYRRAKAVDPHASTHYFRANVSGMAWLREVMRQAGLLDESMQAPELPASDDDHTHWLATTELLRATRSADPAAIPAFKFGTNESWIVTPEECRRLGLVLRPLVVGSERALTFSDGQETRQALRFLREFLLFCESSARDGFEVR
jgi:hypothetical protein